MNKLKVNSVVERKIKSGAQLLEKKDFDTSLVNQLVQLFFTVKSILRDGLSFTTK